ncbi:MAG: ABC transporter permease [Actinobacteria bacterium]|nr:MAG: ABC transporter permease [Actinomycetota bacterium]
MTTPDLRTELVLEERPTGRATRLSAATRRLQYFREGGLVVAILLTGTIFALINSTFVDVQNLTNIASQISFIGVLAVSMTFVIITGEIDLSVGSMVAVAAVVFGTLLTDGVPLWAAIVLTLLAGCGMGAVNGALSIVLRVPTIIITLGMLSAYRGLADEVANGYPLGNYSKTGWFWAIGDQRLFGHIPYDALVLLVFALGSGYVLRRTRTGLHVYAMGSDRRAAERAGLHVNRIRLGVLVFNGLAAGIAALLAVTQAQTADPNLGTGYELEAIAAVIIGGAKLAGGSGTVLASVFGLLLIGMIQNGLVIVGVSIYLLVVVSGLVVIAAVAIDRFFVRRREATMSG